MSIILRLTELVKGLGQLAKVATKVLFEVSTMLVALDAVVSQVLAMVHKLF